MIVFVIAAHPDDEVLGCGGTIVKHVRQGDQVFCLILGEGVTSRYPKRDVAPQEEVNQLKLDVRQAAEILGIQKAFFGDFPDNKFDTVPLLDIIKRIEEVKQEVKPDVIYTHHSGDLNIDHQITCKAVLTAFRPMMGENVREIYSFEVPSSTEWNVPDSQGYFKPNVFVDVLETFEKKLAAMKVYRTEIRSYPHPRSPEALKIIAKRWGIVVGKEMVEAFELIRKVEG